MISIGADFLGGSTMTAGGGRRRPASTASLAPVTAHPACPRCGGRLVQLEEPTCLPCGWADYTLKAGSCGICREPLPGDRRLYCSSSCMTAMLHRRKAQAKRDRVRWGRCAWCGVPSGATYCPRHRSSVRSAQRSWRERRLASGLCLKCSVPRVTARHCDPHRQEHPGAPRGAAQGWPLPAVRRAQRDG